MVLVQNLQERDIKLSSFSFSLYYTFSWKPCTNLPIWANLRTLQMKQQVSESVVRRHLKTSQTSQENICVWVSWPATILKRNFDTATVAASEVSLVFSKESETKTNATVSSAYQIKLKKVFAVAKIQKQLLQMLYENEPTALLKRAPALQNFLEHLFRKTTVNAWLWKSAPNFRNEGSLFLTF